MSDQLPPIFVDRPDELEVEEGGLIQITVIVDGQPEPIVTWRKLGEELVSGNKYQVCEVF